MIFLLGIFISKGFLTLLYLLIIFSFKEETIHIFLSILIANNNNLRSTYKKVISTYKIFSHWMDELEDEISEI